QVQPQAIQRFIENLLEYPVHEVKKLGSGATSTAWRINCGSDQFVFRTTNHATNRQITYRSEFLILKSLYAKGLPVPEPICNSFEQVGEFDENVSAWAITRLVVGDPILKNPLTAKVANQLGEFLQILHELPCSNFGRLDEQSSNLKGQQTTQISGISARWCWAVLWSYDNSVLSEHPIASMAPNLLNSLMRVETELWRITTQDAVVINHSDLYGEHIFTLHDNLSGIIDFGAAFIGIQGWDFAVLAYYHGWEMVKVTLKSYSQNSNQYSYLLYQAHYLALVVGLYKLEKAVKTKRDVNKQQRIIQFVAETLSLLN
ncbi:MAG: aminoglycoside phosphotransferase family protein, partial [Chloroflexota bacterium]